MGPEGRGLPGIEVGEHALEDVVLIHLQGVTAILQPVDIDFRLIWWEEVGFQMQGISALRLLQAHTGARFLGGTSWELSTSP